MEEPSQLVEQRPSLEVRGLRVVFHTFAGIVKAIEGIDLTVYKHELLGLVGESGCGKSVTALAIAGLLPANAEIKSGEILLQGQGLLKKSKKDLRRSRLSDIAIVFQDPMTYLNPVMSIGTQLTEMFVGNSKFYRSELVNFRLNELEDNQISSRRGNRNDLEEERLRLISLKNASHEKLKKSEVKRLAHLRAIYYLKLVNLPEPERIMKMYPFELSGGMRQRAMIAMALIRRPKLLLADEITTALDVTVQAQVLKLLKELRDRIDASIVVITHDLGVVAQVCDRVAIMYAGNVVEIATVKEMFKNPLHPYTKGLLAAIPRIDTSREDLDSIKGTVPDLIFPPGGCRFNPRCPFVLEKCPNAKPSLIEVTPGHLVSCFLYSS